MHVLHASHRSDNSASGARCGRAVDGLTIMGTIMSAMNVDEGLDELLNSLNVVKSNQCTTWNVGSKVGFKGHVSFSGQAVSLALS